MINKFGLPRHIPEDVKLEVRRRSKFGCVVCRCAIYQYEHIDPEYVEAKTHDPENICLLCGACHDRVTRRRLSKETVKECYLKVQRSPEIRRPFENLDLAAEDIHVEIGTVKFQKARHLLRINGRNLLSITAPKEGSSFPALNGIFCDRLGRETFRITDNVWEGPIDAWDISVIGAEVTVKMAAGLVALAFKIIPPNKVVINQLDMCLENCHIVCDEKGLLVGQIHEGDSTYIGMGDFTCQGAEIGVDVDAQSGCRPCPTDISLVGGGGLVLGGTGIRIAVGAGSMVVSNLAVWVK